MHAAQAVHEAPEQISPARIAVLDWLIKQLRMARSRAKDPDEVIEIAKEERRYLDELLSARPEGTSR